MAEASVALRFKQLGQREVVEGVRGVRSELGALKGGQVETALAGDLLVDRFNRLRQQASLGAISQREYATQLRTTLADLRAFAAQTKLSADSEAYFARQTTAIQNELTSVGSRLQRSQGAFQRAAFGVQTLGLAMQHGRFSAQALAAALGTLSIGTPWIGAIVAGLSLIASTYGLIRSRADDASEAVTDFSRLRIARHFSAADLQATAREELRGAENELFRLQGPPTAPGADATAQTRRLTEAERDRAVVLRTEIIPELRGIVAYNENSVRIAERERRAREGTRNALREQRELMRDLLRVGPHGGVSPIDLDAIDRQVSGLVLVGSETLRAELAKERGRILEAWLDALLPPELETDANVRASQQVAGLVEGLKSVEQQARQTAEAITAAFVAIGEGLAGQGSVVENVIGVGLRALAKELRVKAAKEAAEALASLAFGDVRGAALHGAAAAAFGTAAGLAGGFSASLSRGGAGGASAAGFREGARDVADRARGDLVITIEGGRFLDMDDPRQFEAFRRAMEEATGRRVVVRSA